MEIVKTTEEAMVLQCLEKMLVRAEEQTRMGNQLPNHEVWKEHVRVIGRAIHATKIEIIQTEVY